MATGKSVIVRVNDRGPFLHGRVIDLSFAAAERIGIAQKGSGEVEVEAILPTGAPALTASAPLPPVAVPPTMRGRHGRGGAGGSDGTCPGRELRKVDSSCNSGRLQILPMRRISLRISRTRSAPIGVEANVRQVNGLFRVFAGPYPTRDDAKRTADRLRDALGLPSTIAIH